MKNPREPSVLAVFSVIVDDVYIELHVFYFIHICLYIATGLPVDKLFVSVYYIIAQRILGSRIGAQLPELILDKKKSGLCTTALLLFTCLFFFRLILSTRKLRRSICL